MQRPVPAWFPDAGLGIFIHWGLYSVPAYAPLLGPGESLPELIRDDPRHLGARLPYAEWYANAMAIPTSATAHHHHQVYGDAPYTDFQAVFEAGLQRWDPEEWAKLFEASGAGYVVVVTKHSDGYCLWPTGVRHPTRPGWCSTRDLVGEVADAVRARGLRFGVYYSTGFDWSVEHLVVRELADAQGTIPRSAAYARYVTDQLDELIDRYAPSIVWADMGTPPGFDVAAFKARLLRRVPDAVVNDRWDHPVPGSGSALGRRVMNWVIAHPIGSTDDRPLYPGRHRLADFRTPEFSRPHGPTNKVWEMTRGIGSGFGYNAFEPDDRRIGAEELVRLYREVRAGGGNLLLNIGPRADGSIDEAEASRVRFLGAHVR